MLGSRGWCRSDEYSLLFVASRSTIHGGARSVTAGVCSKIFDGKQLGILDRRRRRLLGLCLAVLCTFNTYRSGYDSNVYGMYFVAGIVGVEREKVGGRCGATPYIPATFRQGACEYNGVIMTYVTRRPPGPPSFCKRVPPILDACLFRLVLLHDTLAVSSPNSATSSSVASSEAAITAFSTSPSAVAVFLPRQRAFSSRLLPPTGSLVCSFFFEPAGYLTPTELTVTHTNC